jgi:short-subunit dehydrogenase
MNNSATRKVSRGVVVITGGSSGIGRCTAGLFAKHGWSVGLISRSAPALQAAYEDIAAYGVPGAIEQGDVTDIAALELAARSIESKLGPIDVWINSAGNGTFARFVDTPQQEFERVTDVTYHGTVNGTRVALRRMLPRDRGRIINVCSGIAFHGMPLLTSYSGAKYAVRGFSQALQTELARDRSNVTVSTIFPPAVNTPFFDHAVSRMGRMGRPMWPVYQPIVVAKAIWLSVHTPRDEVRISFTTVFFSLFTRYFPGTIKRMIRSMSYEKQLADNATTSKRYRPTLFQASKTHSSVQGGFGKRARKHSLHLIWLQILQRRKS